MSHCVLQTSELSTSWTRVFNWLCGSSAFTGWIVCVNAAHRVLYYTMKLTTHSLKTLLLYNNSEESARVIRFYIDVVAQASPRDDIKMELFPAENATVLQTFLVLLLEPSLKVPDTHELDKRASVLN